MTTGETAGSGGHVRRSRGLLVPWLVAIAILAVLAALRFWLPDPALSLQYLRTLIWPVLAVAVVYLLRERLLEKLDDVAEWAGFGQSVKFGRALEATGRAQHRLSNTLRAADARTGMEEDANPTPIEAPPEAAGAPDAAVVPSARPEPPGQGHAEGESRSRSDLRTAQTHLIDAGQTAEAERRRVMEETFTEGAAWGWEMAQLGFRSAPTPVIRWSADGQPEIQYGVGQGGPSTKDLAIRAHRLESEIRALELLIGNRSTNEQARLLGQPDSERRLLASLKENLRQIDPDSPYAQ